MKEDRLSCLRIHMKAVGGLLLFCNSNAEPVRFFDELLQHMNRLQRSKTLLEKRKEGGIGDQAVNSIGLVTFTYHLKRRSIKNISW
ncbi:hypothetical protein [Paenibacillus sp. GXUN7292]|uniref:hypothetical protein n=1 Tax=Paenibacillus sp. GXUN7292 TaxID=3422499 RepID=UPI003D7E7F65